MCMLKLIRGTLNKPKLIDFLKELEELPQEYIIISSKYPRTLTSIDGIVYPTFERALKQATKLRENNVDCLVITQRIR